MLKGNITSLRAIEKKDLKSLMNWRNKPSFRQFFREHREINIYNQNLWFKEYVKKKDTTHMFSIIENKTNELIGACGLCYIDWINKNADFSIYIGKNNIYIDEKFAIDSANILLNYGFNVLNLHRIWAEIYEFDKKKIKMFKKLKFQLDGRHKETYFFKNKWHDSLFFGILSKNFSKKNKEKNMKNKFKYYKNSLNLNNKSVLITGGTGSFGNACVNKILECFKPKKLIIFSRDEHKQN